MSMNYTGSSENTANAGENALDPVTETYSPMFAPVPSWERGKKKRGLGARKTVAAAPIVTTTAAGLGATVTLDDGAPLAAPIGRPTTSAKRQGGLPVAAIGAGILALGALAAGGWYATQPRDNVVELTPGVSDATTTAAMAPMVPAMTVPLPARTTTTTTTVRATAPVERRAAPVRTARVTSTRPASANSAQTTGIDASGTATLPSAPEAYSGTASSSANTSATSPATVNPAPVAIPSTPPVAAEPAPAPITPIEPTLTPGA